MEAKANKICRILKGAFAVWPEAEQNVLSQPGWVLTKTPTTHLPLVLVLIIVIWFSLPDDIIVRGKRFSSSSSSSPSSRRE